MMHWIFILVGFAVGFFFGGCAVYLALVKLGNAYSQVMGAVKAGAKAARF